MKNKEKETEKKKKTKNKEKMKPYSTGFERKNIVANQNERKQK